MNPAWKGVAYKALLGAYRVFNCEGSVTTEWLLGALDQAVADGMNIINLSMGTSWAAPLGLSFASRLAR
jgi:subtilisin family serine protease